MAKRKDEKDGLSAAMTPLQPGAGQTAPRPSNPTDEGFVPGTVFAGRYRMVTLVGKGGMGEVWRVDDLVLETPVALKLLYSTDADAREHLLREVRLARLITHPAVCRVFDVGESDGRVFYSMEFIEGEDLATLLRRAGRLTEERVLDIGRQLCDGLAAAHARGVLHRDLKPANVLIDEDGSVRITDFGIAIARTEGSNRALIGTPGYMAPEQLILGATLSERTDIYAIGLILYELLVGQRPFADAASALRPAAPPSEIVPDVDIRLDRALVKALSRAPDERPPSAAALAALLPAKPPVARRRRLLPWLAGAALALMVAAVAVASSLVWPNTPATLTDQDTIVLADFVNTTNEPVFDGTLKVALAVALEQSPFLKIFPDESVRATLRLMERQPDEPVTRSLAREIALREQLKALVSGSIGPIGSHYVVAIEAANAASGDIMAREQFEVESKEQVLTLLGQATARLREKLGESLPSIQRFDVPLARATTSSLEALHAYSLALDQGRVLLRLDSVPHLERALDLDPDFALAHALLSGIYTNVGQSASARPHALRAYELRDRVSERERFFISWRYYVDALQSWDRALALASEWTASYPREAFAFNSLGLALANFGERERAIAAFREARRLDPTLIPPHRNLAESLIALNRFDEARTSIDESSKSGIVSADLRQLSYVLRLIAGDVTSLGDAAGPDPSDEDRMWSFEVEARAAAFSGRVAAAHEVFEQASELALRRGLDEVAARWKTEDALSHALTGQCAEARRDTTAGLELGRDSTSLGRASLALAMCDDGDAAMRLSRELGERFPDATLTVRIQLPVVAAAVALRRGDAERARALLEPVRVYERSPTAAFWPSYLRGQAYLRSEDGAAAATEFRSILAHRGEAPTSALFPLAQLGLARAAAMQGDAGEARMAYGAFLNLWRDADVNLPVLEEARNEMAGVR